MNQVTISPNNKDTLLLAAVTENPIKIELHKVRGSWVVLCIYEGGKIEEINTGIWEKYNLIQVGLSSSITEEQAKDLVKSERFNGFTYYSNYNDPGNVVLWAKYSLELLIESSGLTIGKDQDCLIILKID